MYSQSARCWFILLVVSGAVGLFLRRALFGLLVPFPATSTNPAIEQALRSTRRSLKRAGMVNTIFCFLVTAAYLWAILHFWNISLAAAAFLIMVVVVEHYAQTPRWVRFWCGIRYASRPNPGDANRWPSPCLASHHEHTSIAICGRSLQRWLILFSLGSTRVAHQHMYLLSLAVAVVVGLLVLLSFGRWLGRVRFSLSNAFWCSLIGHVIPALVGR